jgi:beta-N-acetylhexosaminidase
MDTHEIGNLFVIGFKGTQFTPEVRDLMDSLRPSGVILFSRNIEDTAQTAQLNYDLQSHAQTEWGEGIFIGVDQEGGRVRRLRDPYREFPPALQLASSQQPEEAVREFARVTAHEIGLAGFNLDFVPVLDVLGRDEVDKTCFAPGQNSNGNYAGRRDYPLRKALSRAWGNRCRFAQGPSR